MSWLVLGGRNDVDLGEVAELLREAGDWEIRRFTSAAFMMFLFSRLLFVTLPAARCLYSPIFAPVPGSPHITVVHSLTPLSVQWQMRVEEIESAYTKLSPSPSLKIWNERKLAHERLSADAFIASNSASSPGPRALLSGQSLSWTALQGLCFIALQSDSSLSAAARWIASRKHVIVSRTWKGTSKTFPVINIFDK